MSQAEQIKAYLKGGGSLTPMEALRMFSTFRLAARIGELRKEGNPIGMRRKREGGKEFAEYYWVVQEDLFG